MREHCGSSHDITCNTVSGAPAATGRPALATHTRALATTSQPPSPFSTPPPPRHARLYTPRHASHNITVLSGYSHSCAVRGHYPARQLCAVPFSGVETVGGVTVVRRSACRPRRRLCAAAAVPCQSTAPAVATISIVRLQRWRRRTHGGVAQRAARELRDDLLEIDAPLDVWTQQGGAHSRGVDEESWEQCCTCQ